MIVTKSGLTPGDTVQVTLVQGDGQSDRVWYHEVPDSGEVAITLQANDELAPAGSFYKWVEDYGGTPTTRHVVVPRGFGRVEVTDVLADFANEDKGFLRLGAPGLADVDAVHAAITDTGVAQTVTTGITDPDIPRNITATAGGTATDIKAIQVTVTGTNEDDEVISETLPAFTVDTAGTVTGSKVFKTVTSISLPAHDGTGATTSVGYGNTLGVGRKLGDADQVVLAVLGTSIVAPTVTVDAEAVEGNSVDISSGTYNGSKEAVVFLG